MHYGRRFGRRKTSAHLGASGGKQNHLTITTGKQPLVLIGLRDLLHLLDEGGTVLERRARPDVIHQRALATVLCSRALRVQHIGELACEAHILVLALEVHVVRGVVAVVGGLELVAVNDEVVLRAFLLLYAQFDGAIQAVALVEAALDELGGWVERVEHRGTVEQRLDVLATRCAAAAGW